MTDDSFAIEAAEPLDDVLMPVPVLPLRDLVVLPGTSVPLFVGRPTSLRALEVAAERGNNLLLLAQRESDQEQVTPDNLYEFGALVQLNEVLHLADGTVKAVVSAQQRARVLEIQESEGAWQAQIEVLKPQSLPEQEVRQYKSVLRQQFSEYANKTSRKIAREVTLLAEKAEHLGELVDLIALHAGIELYEMQRILELYELSERTEYLMKLLEDRIEMGELDKRLRSRIKKQIEKNQKEYYLTEQIKAAQKELSNQEGEDEMSQLRGRIKDTRLPKAAQSKALAELKKLEMMSPISAEASVIRNYLGWILDLPWSKTSRIQKDLNKAAQVLDEDHYGLEDVKERILEYLAVQMRTRKSQSTVLCLVGPPGVGKTSLGKSIARATGRQFVHMALGGMRDEAEIRGHRRTYVGAMPGRIVQRMAQAGTKNPLFLLDELDKIGMDYRGDPAAALLEVLDPEQNHAFNDHFLETEYDLSSVMFVCTANTMNIPPALIDRMEVVRLPGYTEEEKEHIATHHLIPKQMERTGLKASELQIPSATIQQIIEGYTREAGVRQLERRLARIARKVVLTAVRESSSSKKKDAPISVTIEPENLQDYLGVQEYHPESRGEGDRVGQVTGLAWTAAGGEILTIESVCIAGGRGRVIKTGSLGDVMQESVQAALTVARNCAVGMEVIEGYPENCDIHLHLPSGATPKDGPSAGLGMTMAVLSSITNLPVPGDIAVTGEITLRGEVLRIGALKEKLLAARRGGIKTVLIPADNEAELSEISDHIKDSLEIVPVRWIREVWPRVFGQSLTEKKLKTLSMPPPQRLVEYSIELPKPDAPRH